MARTGQFGRLPRSAPDITSALIAALREADAQRERNIVDAWKNGGEFEGKKVTDEMLLKFFDDRLKGLSKDDPLYDEAKNTAEQYRFAVRNSKQELLYAQGKVGDGGMSNFYRNEAAKHPVDSEMYRNLMRLSAQYKDRAGSGRAAGRARGRASAAGASDTPKKSELAFTEFTNTLIDVARQRGILNSSENPENTTETTGQGIGDLQLNERDFGAMQGLINEIATSPEWAPYRAEMTAYIKKYGDPAFNGDFSLQGMLQMRASANAGIKARLQQAYASGTKTQQKALLKALKLNIKAGAVLSVLDPMAELEEQREAWFTAVTNPNADPFDIFEATNDYTAEVDEVWRELQGLAASAGAADGGWLSVHAGRALRELMALRGETITTGATLFEESRGNVTGPSSEEGDAFSTAESIKANNEALGKLLTGEYVIGRLDDQGKPTRDATSPLTAVRLADLQAASDPVVFIGGAPRSINGYDADGNPTILPTGSVLTAVIGQVVTAKPVGGASAASGNRPTTGFAMQLGTREDIGAKFVYPDGTTLYQYWDTAGTMRYTTDNPWITDPNAAVNERDLGDHVEISWTTAPLANTAVGQSPGAVNPNSVIASEYLDPALADGMNHSVFKSAYLGYLVASNGGVRPLQLDKDPALAAALIAESRGSQATLNTLAAEVQRYGALDAKNWAAEERTQTQFHPKGTPLGQVAGDLLRGVLPADMKARFERESKQRSGDLIDIANASATQTASGLIKGIGGLMKSETGKALVDAVLAQTGFTGVLPSGQAPNIQRAMGANERTPNAAPINTVGIDPLARHRQGMIVNPTPAPLPSGAPPPPKPSLVEGPEIMGFDIGQPPPKPKPVLQPGPEIMGFDIGQPPKPPTQGKGGAKAV